MSRPTVMAGSLRAGFPPAAVLVMHVILSLFWQAYDRLGWIDMPVHFLGGAAIGWFFSEMILLLEGTGWAPRSHWTAHAVMVFGLVALATVAWELGEFVWDLVTAMNVQRGVANIMSDQLMGLAGGAALVAMRIPVLRRGRAIR